MEANKNPGNKKKGEKRKNQEETKARTPPTKHELINDLKKKAANFKLQGLQENQ